MNIVDSPFRDPIYFLSSVATPTVICVDHVKGATWIVSVRFLILITQSDRVLQFFNALLVSIRQMSFRIWKDFQIEKSLDNSGDSFRKTVGYLCDSVTNLN